MSGRNVGVSQRNTVLNRNRRLLLWWSQQKEDVNDVNLQYDNSQSGHGPRGHGRIAPLDPPLGLLRCRTRAGGVDHGGRDPLKICRRGQSTF